MNIRMNGHYDHFPNHHYEDGKPFIDCYNDSFVRECDTFPDKSIALMIEPRTIEPNGYKFLLENDNWERFKYIFTHDSELLQLPNAKLLLWGNVWGWSNESKTKFCSMISSDKELCELHKVRKQLAFDLQDKIDCFGTFNDGERVDTYTAHAAYRFAVVIENYIDDYWFTEKICNCFANKVVPIYMGARKIDRYFNKNGIIHINCSDGIKECIGLFSEDGGKHVYEIMKNSVIDNYIRVKDFENFETWFFRNYGELLEDM